MASLRGVLRPHLVFLIRRLSSTISEVTLQVGGPKPFGGCRLPGRPKFGVLASNRQTSEKPGVLVCFGRSGSFPRQNI